MLLVRQAILDCQYLDKASEECLVPAALLSTATTQAPNTPHTPHTPHAPHTPHTPHSATSPTHPSHPAAPHSVAFATSILTVLDAHNVSTFTRCLHSLVASVTQLTSSEMAPLCDMKVEPPGSLGGDSNPFPRTSRSRNNSSNSLASESDPRSACLYPDPYLARTAVGQRTAQVKVLLDRFGSLIIACFSDICADYRPVIEIYGVSASASPRRKDAKVVCYSSLLVGKFVEGLCGSLEGAGGVRSFDKGGDKGGGGSHRGEGNRFKVIFASFLFNLFHLCLFYVRSMLSYFLLIISYCWLALLLTRFGMQTETHTYIYTHKHYPNPDHSPLPTPHTGLRDLHGRPPPVRRRDR